MTCLQVMRSQAHHASTNTITRLALKLQSSYHETVIFFLDHHVFHRISSRRLPPFSRGVLDSNERDTDRLAIRTIFMHPSVVRAAIAYASTLQQYGRSSIYALDAIWTAKQLLHSLQ